MDNIEKIRKILLQEWDPFCVGENPNLTDEYNNFVGKIAVLLSKHASAEELSVYLMNIEKELHASISEVQRAKTVSLLLK